VNNTYSQIIVEEARKNVNFFHALTYFDKAEGRVNMSYKKANTKHYLFTSLFWQLSEQHLFNEKHEEFWKEISENQSNQRHQCSIRTQAIT